MKTEYQIIAVDFDGTLCTDCFPKIGQPNTALIELLKGLRRQGRQIISVSYTHLTLPTIA